MTNVALLLDAFDGVAFPRDAGFLSRVALVNLVTRAGDLDLAFTPAATAVSASRRFQ